MAAKLFAPVDFSTTKVLARFACNTMWLVNVQHYSQSSAQGEWY